MIRDVTLSVVGALNTGSKSGTSTKDSRIVLSKRYARYLSVETDPIFV